ncbi:MAG: ATP-dependent 6-phosphofructokinase, partial [Defluviitaleaceae bacterium]|nr:ATP-dependent 6-phosphofructokinase [Defluviitaleaceae bacterium]
KAYEMIKNLGIEGLIVIGGDGSLTGAKKLKDHGLPVVGIPGTIDLDLECTEYTIGFDTAVNTAVDAIGRIRDTSSSHERCSVIEVMGRHCGYLALWSAMTSGACAALVPEVPEIGINDVIDRIIKNRLKGKTHNIIVVAEGVGNSAELAKLIEARTGIESRYTILGHLQRGGPPTVLDRKHATSMGSLAVDALLSGNANKITIIKDGKCELMDIDEALNYKREFDRKLYDMIAELSL